jgi:hypothetical protein
MDLGGFLRGRSFYGSPFVRRAYRVLRRVSARLGFDVVLRTFYSPIPNLDALPADTFERRSELPGLRFELDEQLAFVERHAATMRAFPPQRYDPHNPSYGLLDASLLYAILRQGRPRRIVELGSGHSTLVTSQAAGENAADGHPCHFEAYDPYPSVADDGLPGLAALHRLAAQDVPLDAFAALGEGDVLFVDTTHTVKLGSDVTHIVLEILPRLAPGVIVHVHDIFLPYEYPRFWPEDMGLYWNEQYLLQAFLACNPSFEVLACVAALRRDREPELAALVPGAMNTAGTAFWMRRVAS